jgi:putative nucleotidyltransferase with HDIG domain
MSLQPNTLGRQIITRQALGGTAQPLDAGLLRSALSRAQAGRRASCDLCAALVRLRDRDALCARLLEGLCQLVGADNGSVMLLDASRQYLDIVADIALPSDTQRHRLPVQGTMSGFVLYVGEPLVLPGQLREQTPQQREVGSSMMIPVMCAGLPAGVVNLNRVTSNTVFDQEDLELAATVVPTFGGVLESIQAALATRQLMLATIRALALTIEAKDPYTRGHCERVARYARGLAEELQLSATTVEQIEMGATLHDIGKIGVSDAVLLKPGALTEAEFAEIKQHPARGAEIIRPVGLPQATFEAVLSHHERFDGSGYPRGIAGEAIPIAARIVAVVDAFDAMTIDRCYRSARSTAEALVELEHCAGTQFDPKVVSAFLSYWRQRGEARAQADGPRAATVRAH